MTMHMCGPALTTNGKRKGKPKFRNAQEAQQARELDTSWRELQKKWAVDADDKKRTRALKAEPLVYKLSTPIGRTNTHHIPSISTGGNAAAKPVLKYTGSEMLGISQLHKSNAIPVFRQEDVIDIARMRR